MVFRLGAEHPDAIISAQRPQQQTLWQRWRLSRDVRYQKRLDYHGVCQWAKKRWLPFSWTFIFVLEHPVEQPVPLNGQDSKPSWELHVKSTLSLVFTFSYKTFSFSLPLRLMLCRSSYLLRGGSRGYSQRAGRTAGLGLLSLSWGEPSAFCRAVYFSSHFGNAGGSKRCKRGRFPIWLRAERVVRQTANRSVVYKTGPEQKVSTSAVKEERKRTSPTFITGARPSLSPVLKWDANLLTPAVWTGTGRGCIGKYRWGWSLFRKWNVFLCTHGMSLFTVLLWIHPHSVTGKPLSAISTCYCSPTLHCSPHLQANMLR